MKTAELIDMLKRIDPRGHGEVRIWVEDFDEYMPVTGAVYDDGYNIDLQADETP